MANRQILNFIEAVRDSHPKMVEIYTKGSCLNFHIMLRRAFGGEAWFNINHVVTKIDDCYYDITGVVSPKGYMKYGNIYATKKRNSRSFTQMYQMGNKYTV